MSWMKEGKVSQADWNALTDLRKRLREEAEEKRLAASKRKHREVMQAWGARREDICSEGAYRKRQKVRVAAMTALTAGEGAEEGDEEGREAATPPATKQGKKVPAAGGSEKEKATATEAEPEPAELVLLDPKAAKAEARARAAEAAEQEEEPLTCFNDLLDGAGQSLFEEATEDAFHISVVTMQSLEDGDNAAFNALHPRKRRELLDQAEMHFCASGEEKQGSHQGGEG